jgi:hypothetical protein
MQWFNVSNFLFSFVESGRFSHTFKSVDQRCERQSRKDEISLIFASKIYTFCNQTNVEIQMGRTIRLIDVRFGLW